MLSYFADNMWQAWLIVSIVCLILELTNGDFFIFCFAVGGLGGMITSWIIDSTMWQVIIFAAVSVLSLFFVRPVMLKYFHKKDSDRPSNADALMGRTGTVSQTIVAGDHGRVKIDGDDWKAVSTATTDIPVGTKVKVVGRDSIILTVTPVNQ